jgi:hypothetical protein
MYTNVNGPGVGLGAMVFNATYINIISVIS